MPPRCAYKTFDSVGLLERYGMDTVLTATHQLMDYTERVLRQRIAEIPDGEYRAEGFLDDDSRNRGVRLPIKVCVRVKGDSIEIDLTGSADQVETGFNVPFEGSTKVASFCAIRSLLFGAETSEIKVPSNQGSFRPISVIAPKAPSTTPTSRPRRKRGSPRSTASSTSPTRRSRRCCRTTSSPAAPRPCRSRPTPV